MRQDKLMKILNLIIPVIGAMLMVFYEVCDTSCSALRGTFLGVDLKYVGILFMAALLALNLPPVARYAVPVSNLRTMMLAGALGGEILLVRFQIVYDTFCPFCLAFGLCVLILFAANIPKMNQYLALGAFLAGLGAFALFFAGSVLPLY
ncbi:MAG: hypothetical protein QG555_1632 [Thermodesulfobacteriota bacterium]|nr:hypothetical protein [Thermodesulfobacteriota bacterium]